MSELTPFEVYRDYTIKQAKIGYHYSHNDRTPGDMTDIRWGDANSFEQARRQIDQIESISAPLSVRGCR